MIWFDWLEDVNLMCSLLAFFLETKLYVSFTLYFQRRFLYFSDDAI